MATHASAAKRARQNVKLRLRNRSNMSTMRTAIKKVLEAVTKKDVSAAETAFVAAQSVIAKTKQKGAIHKNNMARRISRLAAGINKMKIAVATGGAAAATTTKAPKAAKAPAKAASAPAAKTAAPKAAPAKKPAK